MIGFGICQFGLWDLKSQVRDCQDDGLCVGTAFAMHFQRILAHLTGFNSSLERVWSSKFWGQFSLPPRPPRCVLLRKRLRGGIH